MLVNLQNKILFKPKQFIYLENAIIYTETCIDELKCSFDIVMTFYKPHMFTWYDTDIV